MASGSKRFAGEARLCKMTPGVSVESDCGVMASFSLGGLESDEVAASPGKK